LHSVEIGNLSDSVSFSEAHTTPSLGVVALRAASLPVQEGSNAVANKARPTDCGLKSYDESNFKFDPNPIFFFFFFFFPQKGAPPPPKKRGTLFQDKIFFRFLGFFPHSEQHGCLAEI